MGHLAKITMAVLIATAPVVRSACVCGASVSVSRDEGQSACCPANNHRGATHRSAPVERRAPCPCPEQTIETTNCCDTAAELRAIVPSPCFDPALDGLQPIAAAHDYCTEPSGGDQLEWSSAAVPFCAVTILYEHLLL